MRSLYLVLLSLSVAACGDRAYRVGVLSRSGAFEGADLAAREINGKNGIDGTPLRIVRGDTMAAVDAAHHDSSAIVDRLTADTTVKVVLQQSTQGLQPGVLRIYLSRGVPVLVLGPALDKPQGRGIYHLMPTAREEAALMSVQAARLWQPKRVAIVHSDDAYGLVLATELQDQLQGATFVLKTPFAETIDTTTVAAVERAISAAKPDVLFWIGPPRVLGILLVRLRQHLPDLRIMGSDAAEAKKVYENPDGLYTGLVFVRASEPTGDTARVNNFQYRFAMWMGGQGTSEALLAYDVTGMIAQAMREGAVSRQQLRDYIASLGRSRAAYSGVTGPIAFDSVGVLRRPLGLAEVREDGVKAVPLK